MINKCDSCVHAKTCYGQNDDYADDGGLCVHYRHNDQQQDDTVSRQAIVDLLKKWADGYSYIEIPTADALKAANVLPTADKKGEWIDSGTAADGFPVYKCSVCGRQIATFKPLLYNFPFCHCGADMRKGGTE